MTPADVNVVLARLASGVAALPQAATQLSDILDQARNDYVLSTDDLTESTDPGLVLDTARLHLRGVLSPHPHPAAHRPRLASQRRRAPLEPLGQYGPDLHQPSPRLGAFSTSSTSTDFT